MASNTFRTDARNAGYDLPVPGSIQDPVEIGVGGGDVSVLSYGAAGDGVTDDSAAFQRAVDALVDTGGMLRVPPDRTYVIGTTIEIRSYYPIWITSEMSFGALGNINAPQNGHIVPTGSPEYLFRWRRPAGATAIQKGGGGLANITIADPDYRMVSIDTAVYVEDAIWFEIRDCTFAHLLGTAIQGGLVTVLSINDCTIRACGDTSKPTVWASGVYDGVAGEFCGMYIRSLIIEQSFSAPYIQADAGTGINIYGLSYFEADVVTAATCQKFLTGLGHFVVRDAQFNGNTNTSIDLASDTVATPGQSIRGCRFWNASGVNPVIKIGANCHHTCISDCQGTHDAAQTGRFITSAASDVQVDNIWVYGGGGIAFTAGSRPMLSNAFFRLPGTAAAGYVIDFTGSTGGKVSTCTIAGFDTSVGHGIALATTTCIGNTIDDLAANAHGIVSTVAADVLSSNAVSGITGTGVPITYVNGTKAIGNTGYVTTGTAVGDPGGAATLNAESGTITSPALTTAAGSGWTLTLTNSVIATTSRLAVSAARGTCSQGDSVITLASPANGSAVITLKNAHATDAYNGTMKINFTVIN
jgi:hypothetical protein